MIQELKKDIKAVVLSEYKLMACILVVLIIFWKFINKLISTYIVCITETVTNDSLFIALIFFLCPIFIALIKRDYLKRETKKFSQRHLWEFFLFVVYVGFNPSLTPIVVESRCYCTFEVLAMNSVSYKFLFF